MSDQLTPDAKHLLDLVDAACSDDLTPEQAAKLAPQVKAASNKIRENARRRGDELVELAEHTRIHRQP